MSLIVSLFCPLCEDLYDDTEKRPRHGTCLHNVCDACIQSSGNTKCPICDEKDAFTKVLHNHGLESFLVEFNKRNTEELLKELASNTMKLNIGSCKSGKEDCSENLRMCITCAETSKLFKRHPNGKFQIIEQNKLLYLSKALLYCSDCIADGLPDHRQHLFLPFSKIDVIEVNLELWYYIVHAILLDRKMKKEYCTQPSSVPNTFITVYLGFKREAINYEALMKSDRFALMLEQFRFSRQKLVDIHSIPELAEAKEKSVEKAREVIDRIEKVQERQLWVKKEEFKHFVEGFKTMEISAEDPDWKAFMDEITNLSNQFNRLRITNLTNFEATYIDQKIDRKMTEAVQKLGLPEDTPQKFLNFKALCNILQDASDNLERLQKETLEETNRCQEFFDDRMKQLELIIKEDKLALKLVSYELTEKSFLADKKMLEALEAMQDYCEGESLWVRYFPQTYDSDPNDLIYTMMLQERFLSHDEYFPTALFSLSCKS